MAYTPRQYAERQRRRRDGVQRSMRIAEASAVADITNKAIELVSGGISSAQLAAAGHPFSRTFGGAPPLAKAKSLPYPLLPINIQTMELLQSLRVFSRDTTNLGQYWQLQFMSPHSIVLRPGGTRKMRARGFWAALNKFAKVALHYSHSIAFHEAMVNPGSGSIGVVSAPQIAGSGASHGGATGGSLGRAHATGAGMTGTGTAFHGGGGAAGGGFKGFKNGRVVGSWGHGLLFGTLLALGAAKKGAQLGRLGVRRIHRRL